MSLRANVPTIIYDGYLNKTLSKKSILKNTTVYSCISMIAKSVASVPIAVSLKDNDSIHEEQYEYIVNLINKPNTRYNINNLLYKVVEDLLIYGKSYMLRDVSSKDDLEINGIYHIANKSVKPNIQNNTLVGYQYFSKKGWTEEKINVFGKCNILEIEYFSIGSDNIGNSNMCMSPCDTVCEDVLLCNLIDEYNKTFISNCSKFNGIIELSNATDAMIDRMRKYINENPPGSPLCFNNGRVTWKNTQSNNNIYSIECHLHVMKNIARVFGVPPILIGLQESNGQRQYESARQHFWEDTVLPLTIYILTALQDWVNECYTGIKLTAELNSVPAFSNAWFEYAENINKLDFLTREEKRQMCNALFTGKAKQIKIE